MTATILLTGGTGTLGRHILPLLRDAGHTVRVLSRGPRQAADGVGHATGSRQAADGVEHVVGDLATGAGVEAAVDGVETIAHCAGSAKGDDQKADHLVRAAARAGAGHLVYISVVGADRVPVVSGVDRGAFGYYGFKRAAELLIERSGVPWTTLRATQFHDLTLSALKQLTKLPVVPVPAGVRFQPIDSGEVAARLVELALGAPAGLVPDLAGPRIYGFDDLVRGYLRATGRRRPILRFRMPGQAYRAMRAGANLDPDRAVGRRTWEEFLAERVPVGR